MNFKTTNNNNNLQTAKVIYNGKRAETISKNNAKKVLRMGNTKVFTKGVRSDKIKCNNNEIITLD